VRGLLRLAATMTVAAGIVLGASATAWASTPRWLLHVERYQGGISAGVRAMAAPQVVHARASLGLAQLFGSSALPAGPLQNVQMNADSNPPLPQDETSVDYSRANPLVAVAAANDYISGGVMVMRTADGGRTWHSTRINPQFAGSGDFCNGGDPSVVYSARDHAFYIGQLCFFRALPFSEVQIYKSVDNGATWTPGAAASVVVSNFNYAKNTVDTSVFYDQEKLAVDNTPTSPHYGRLYVTYIKFHMLPSGFSDYCPVQVAHTDNVPTADPFRATWQHASVVPDDPGGPGIGESANQSAIPQVQSNGALDVTYALEDCNTSLDRHLRFQKSTNGGRTFLAHPVSIDHPGEFRDNPNKADLLAPTKFRAPIGPGFAVNRRTGVLAYVYQNNVNRPTSGADISIQFSNDGGFHWSHARFLSVQNGHPAPNDQFFPAITSDPSGEWHAIWLDRRRDPSNVNIDTFQADSANGWKNRRITTTSWNPNQGFFTCGCFIGDYNGISASNQAIYPTWTDGRNSAIYRTGIGETDIFTNVEILKH
jgi:hypothetical protein